MHCPSGDKETISSFRREARQLAWHGPVGDCLAQALRAAARFQPRVDASLGPLRKDYPGFVFPGVVWRYEVLVGIGGMHLNRKPRCHIEEFQEQRKSTEMSGKFAEQPLRRPLQQ